MARIATQDSPAWGLQRALQPRRGRRLFDGDWRPTDDVIEALDLLDWDTLELVTAARRLAGEADTAA